MADNRTGKITQVIGAVLDIKFGSDNLPEINDAIDIQTRDGGKLVVEVAQHLGDDTVRCIAMGPTDGLVRGMEAQATGGPISVPVGEATLGRIFNVLGDPIDNKPAPEGANGLPIHRKAPEFSEQSTETEVLEIIPKKNRFVIRTGNGNVTADRVILAAGSKAAPVTGSDGSGYAIAKKMGHRIVPVLPALVQLKCKGKFFQSIAGVRIQGCVSLYVDGDCVCRDTGEIQLTQYGISGIPVFQVSRFATKALKRKQTVTAQIDFLPKLSEQETEQLFESRFREYAHGKTVDEAMVGLLNHKLSDVLLKEAHISLKKPAEEITKKELLQLVKQCKHMEVCVTGSKSFEQAQVCAGGVHTDEINPRTMESKLVPNVYFAGEVVDIDGMCGGYNLQWAWSSGYVAGIHAAG